MSTHDEIMVFVDTETTGLSHETDLLLELGLAIVRVEDLEILATWDTLLVPHPAWKNTPGAEWEDYVRSCMSQFVIDMHTKSGLLEDLKLGDFDHIMAAEIEAIQFLKDWFPKGDFGPMVGSNVANFDRLFIRQNMPALEEEFHYRNIDFSTVKELCRRFNPSVYGKLPPKNENHRVVADLYDSVAEARFYIDNFLWVA